MILNERYLIKTTSDLRKVISNPHPKACEKVKAELEDNFIEFIAHSSLVFVGTSGQSNQLDLSPKGDAAGFVKVLDNKTLIIPERKGNKLAFGFQNILENNVISLAFVIKGVREVLRVNGSVELTCDPSILQLLDDCPSSPAILASVVTIDEAFFHCGKAFIRSKIWDNSSANLKGENSVREHFSKELGVSKEKVSHLLEDDYLHNI